MGDGTQERRRRGPAFVLAAALVAGSPLAGAEPATEAHCDPGLERESDNPMAYGPREGRCEGLYRLKVNSDKILVKSWTAWFEDFDPGGGDLELGWRLPPGVEGPVHVRAVALKARTYYRMDTRRTGSQSSWTWPAQLLGQLRLGRPDLGLMSWAAMPAEAGDERVYLPLTVRQSAVAEPSGYRVALVPGERLVEVTWSVFPAVEGGGSDRSASAGEPLGFGYYPAGVPTVFTIPAPADPGHYVLLLQAQLRTGGAATRELRFYHPGPAAGPAATVPGGTP